MLKLQTLSVIFVLIMLPVIILLSYYIDTQIDTIALQNSYDTKLLNATYDAIVAFELNTVNNNYSTNAESLRRDINASVNTFTKSLANNFGVSGYGSNYMLPYIPALVYTLYDGYYIYAPMPNTTIENENEDAKTTYEHTLKPYVYYTARYKSGTDTDFVINYSLDNYIVLYGNIKGDYHSKAGYLIYSDKFDGKVDINNNIESSENKYYTGAINFTIEFNNLIKNLGDLEMTTDDGQEQVISAKQVFYIDDKNDPEVKTSAFCEHKNSVIKNSIQSNLNSAIASYNKRSEGLDVVYDFKMPILDEEEWDKMLSNVSIIAFMQGLPVGIKTYNNYMIVTSTKNKQCVDAESLYFVTYDPNTLKYDNYYHRINCPLLAEELKNNRSHIIEGHSSINFDGIYDSEHKTYKYFGVGEYNEDLKKYEYPRGSVLACYECIVSPKVGGIIYNNPEKDKDTNGRVLGRTYAGNNHNDNLITFVMNNNNGKDYTNLYDENRLRKLRTAYYNALFKERQNLIKVSSYVNRAS